MTKFKGYVVVIKDRSGSGGIDTSGMTGIIVDWMDSIKKYEVNFYNGWVGWYRRAELKWENT